MIKCCSANNNSFLPHEGVTSAQKSTIALLTISTIGGLIAVVVGALGITNCIVISQNNMILAFSLGGAGVIAGIGGSLICCGHGKQSKPIDEDLEDPEAIAHISPAIAQSRLGQKRPASDDNSTAPALKKNRLNDAQNRVVPKVNPTPNNVGSSLQPNTTRPPSPPKGPFNVPPPPQSLKLQLNQTARNNVLPDNPANTTNVAPKSPVTLVQVLPSSPVTPGGQPGLPDNYVPFTPPIYPRTYPPTTPANNFRVTYPPTYPPSSQPADNFPSFSPDNGYAGQSDASRPSSAQPGQPYEYPQEEAQGGYAEDFDASQQAGSHQNYSVEQGQYQDGDQDDMWNTPPPAVAPPPPLGETFS